MYSIARIKSANLGFLPVPGQFVLLLLLLDYVLTPCKVEDRVWDVCELVVCGNGLLRNVLGLLRKESLVFCDKHSLPQTTLTQSTFLMEAYRGQMYKYIKVVLVIYLKRIEPLGG